MKPLAAGGMIGVAAPASPYDSRSEVLRGVEWWDSQGYKVKLAPHVYARDDYVAGDARRLPLPHAVRPCVCPLQGRAPAAGGPRRRPSAACHLNDVVAEVV